MKLQLQLFIATSVATNCVHNNVIVMEWYCRAASVVLAVKFGVTISRHDFSTYRKF